MLSPVLLHVCVVEYVSIDKGGNQKVDCISQKSEREFWACNISEIHEAPRFDLYMNDLYTMGAGTGRKATGVGIGGFLSPAHVDVTLMHAESNVAWAQELGEDLRLAHFRDNIFCFCPLDQVINRKEKIGKCIKSQIGL